MLVIPGGIATFIGLHLFLVSSSASPAPWSKRATRARRAEEAAARAAARDREPRGRREVTVDPAPQTLTVEAGK